MKQTLAVLVLASSFLGCSSSSSETTAADPAKLDGTWSIVTDGQSPSDADDDELAQYLYDHTPGDWELSLKSGKGTLTLTDESGSESCVVVRDVTLTVNADGSGSIDEAREGTLVSGPESDCSGLLGFGLFGTSSSLQRVSVTKSRLVLVAPPGAHGAFFVVFARK